MSAVSDSDIERMIRGLTIMGGQIPPDGQGYVVVSAIAMLQSLRDERRRSPSYDALLIISQSVAAALERAGVTECDDPGDAIDALAKDAARYLALKKMADVSDMPDAEEDGSICGQIVYSIVIPTGVDRASHVFREKPLPDMDAAIDAAMEGEK